MTITKMNKILKEMKEVIKFENDKTDINVMSSSIDPYRNTESVHIATTINGINISARKEVKNDKN